MATGSKRRERGRFPWWPLVLLLATLYVFWVLPYQQGGRKVEVEFEGSGGK